MEERHELAFVGCLTNKSYELWSLPVIGYNSCVPVFMQKFINYFKALVRETRIMGSGPQFVSPRTKSHLYPKPQISFLKIQFIDPCFIKPRENEPWGSQRTGSCLHEPKMTFILKPQISFLKIQIHRSLFHKPG